MPERRIVGWLDTRTGLVSSVRSFLASEIPHSAGWAQVFGSVSLFLILIQAFTGILLSLNYAGTSGEAYASLTYIIKTVPAGALIHRMHHWGASLLLIVVVCHMIQVFLFSSYKKPREVTWLGGVCLLLTVLAFSLTGYLLPWDNRAYWGTVVTTQILGQAPVIGNFLKNFLHATGGIGTITFARFYSMHVLVLPAASIALLMLHLFLVHRHGVTPAADDRGPGVPFYPIQAFKDVVACFVAFVCLFAAALFLRVPLEPLADPTGTTYIPRPEWYFLFLFQLLKIFQGALEPIGTFVLPAAAIMALFAVPFVDRRKITLVRERTVAASLVVLALAVWTALTVTAYSETPRQPNVANPATSIAGEQVYARYPCANCHQVNGTGGRIGPSLNGVANRHSRTWLIEHFANPQKLSPGTSMPRFEFKGEEEDELLDYLASLK